jgi:hypothetical protein
MRVYVVTGIDGAVFGVCSTKERAEAVRADYNKNATRRESSLFVESHEIDQRFDAINKYRKG